MAVTPLNTRPFAFLFVRPRRDEGHGEMLDEAFLRALKTADPDGMTATRVYRGGVLLAGLSYKMSAIRAMPRGRRKPGSPITAQSGMTQRSDPALYATLVGDFVETCLEQWNTLDPDKFWNYAGNRALDATFVPAVPIQVAEAMDRELRSHPRYIGAVSPDLGNPLHRYLFVDVMFKDAFIRDGSVFVRAGFEGDYDGVFYGADAFSRIGMVTLPDEEFEDTAPPVDLPDSLSARGLVTEMRMQRRMASDVHQKVMTALSRSDALRGVSKPFEWDLSRLPDSPEEVAVQACKLTHYLLDPEHEDGKSKAKFFGENLAITRADWSFLHAQLVDRLKNVSYEEVRLDEHGIRFKAYLPVKGRNDATATIETGWIIRSGERASFVTAFPTQKDHVLEQQAEAPAILPDDLTGDARWQGIYDLADKAGTEAMEACVPKPMVVEGKVYMEGECGGAYVRIGDARKGFARWLKTTGKGDKHYRGGRAVYARQIGQSVETAKAYATAFARVLLRNGVECTVETYLT